VYSLVVLMGR